jgi:predicted RNA-binding protein YlqC (UPF0109 family)
MTDDRRHLSPEGRFLDDLIRVVVGAIVDVPDRIHTVIVESGATVVVELTVAKEDIGKVIGREGAMAQSLRTVLSNAATKVHRRSVLQIIE